MADPDTEDLRERLRLLEAASRPKEPATVGREPSIQGHIVSAISKIKRELELLRLKR